MNSWHITEIMSEQRRRQLDAMNPLRLAALEEHELRDGGVRRAIATAFVRIGTTLDQDAISRTAVARHGTN